MFEADKFSLSQESIKLLQDILVSVIEEASSSNPNPNPNPDPASQSPSTVSDSVGVSVSVSDGVSAPSDDQHSVPSNPSPNPNSNPNPNLAIVEGVGGKTNATSGSGDVSMNTNQTLTPLSISASDSSLTAPDHIMSLDKDTNPHDAAAKLHGIDEDENIGGKDEKEVGGKETSLNSNPNPNSNTIYNQVVSMFKKLGITLPTLSTLQNSLVKAKDIKAKKEWSKEERVFKDSEYFWDIFFPSLKIMARR